MATSYYSTGTISLTNGSAVVTGIGTAWQIALITNGWIKPIVAGGHDLPIASVDSDSEITAEFPWQGPSGTYPYSIQRDGDQVQDNAENSKNLTYLLQEMRKGTLFKYDASGTFADRSLFDGRPKNFSYLVLEGEDAQLWVKASSMEGDWSGPYAYGVGPPGPIGPGGYANPRGTYAAGTAYARNDAVLFNGSSFVALQATTGNAPPNLPATSNAYWQLTAVKGSDGTGVGTVTSIDVSVPAGFVASGGPVTSTGTIAVSFAPGFEGFTTAQAAAIAAGGQNDSTFGLEIADLKGSRLGMKGGVADAFDDETGVDGAASSGQVYDAANDWYAPAPNPGNVTALLHFNGANLSTSAVDSTGLRTWAVAGDAKLSTAQSKFGGASLLLDGTGDYITSTGALAGFNFGTGDFTFDCWVRPATSSGQLFIFDFRSDATNNPCFYLLNGVPGYFCAGAVRITGSAAIPINTWTHVALCRVSGVTRIFVNGTQSGASYTDGNNFIAPTAALIATGTGGSSPFNGYLDEVRFAKQGFYAANFTPESSEYVVPSSSMTLRSVAYVAAAQPATGRLAVQLAQADAITINSDVVCRISRDGGSTWATAALSLSQSIIGPKIYEATGISLSALGAGTSLKWEVSTANGKYAAVSGVVMQWS